MGREVEAEVEGSDSDDAYIEANAAAKALRRVIRTGQGPKELKESAKRLLDAFEELDQMLRDGDDLPSAWATGEEEEEEEET